MKQKLSVFHVFKSQFGRIIEESIKLVKIFWGFENTVFFDVYLDNLGIYFIIKEK